VTLVDEPGVELVKPPSRDLLTPFGWPCQIKDTKGRVLPAPRMTKYMKRPWPVQNAFLQMRAREVFYGGAAGGAKSAGLILAALQFVDVPGYAALLLRKTYEDLKRPGALMHKSHEWLDETDARWSQQDHAWKFPGGGELVFGYAKDYDDMVTRYKSAEFQFVGFDESTQHEMAAIMFLFSRMRAAERDAPPTYDGLRLQDVPIRMRLASNPGEIGHAAHKARYVDPETREPGTWFLKSFAEDNGSLDLEDYTESLKKQHPVNWRRFRYGDWEVRDPSQVFDISKIQVLEARWPAARTILRCRYWDMASTEVEPGKDPDECVGTLYAWNRTDGTYSVEDVVAFRGEPELVERRILQTAQLDGRSVPVVIEQEPGSQGKSYIDHIRRHVLPGFGVHGDRATGNKELRIRALIPTVDSSLVRIVKGAWNGAWLAQIDAYPLVDHDDQADSWAGGHAWVTSPKSRIIV
jgi:predicted phage terminase large subunit-like protein